MGKIDHDQNGEATFQKLQDMVRLRPMACSP